MRTSYHLMVHIKNLGLVHYSAVKKRIYANSDVDAIKRSKYELAILEKLGFKIHSFLVAKGNPWSEEGSKTVLQYDLDR